MKLKDETGLAFPLVLIVVLVLTILGVTLYMFSTAETRQVLLDENKMKAHYVARSGAHAVAAYIIENPSIAGALAEAGESEPYSFAGGTYRVEVGEFIDDNNGGEGDIKEKYVVKSTGTYNNVSQSIEVTVENVGINCALYARNFDVSGGGNLAISGGDIMAGGVEGEDYDKGIVEGFLTDEHKLINRSHDFDPVILPCDDEKLGFDCEEYEYLGDYDGGPGGGNLIVTQSSRYGDITRVNDLIIEPDGYDLLLKADLIRNGNNSGPVLNVKLSKGNTVVIVADTIIIEDINVESEDGGGFLLIYAHDFKRPPGNPITIDPYPSHINIYIYDIDGEGGSFSITGCDEFRGSIYAPTAESVFTGTAEVYGWMITDVVKVTGGGSGGINFRDIKMRDVSINFDFFNIEKWRYGGN